MKKFSMIISALVLAAALSGCGSPAENNDTDIAVTEETTLSSEDIGETETTSEIPSETEVTSDGEETTATDITSEETSAENEVSADFPVGEWYEERAYIYNFDNDGNVSINTGLYNVSGTYKYENGLMSIYFGSGDDECSYTFEVTENDGEYKLTLTEDSGKPYEPAGFAANWIDEGYPSDGNEFILKKGDAPRPAEQSDIIGMWTYEDWLIRFEENGCTGFTPDIEKTDETVTGGIAPDSEDMLLTYYEDKIFVNDETSSEPDIMTRAVIETPGLSDLDGRFTLSGDMDGMVTIENGNIVPYYEDESCGTLSVNGDKVAVTDIADGETIEYDCYFVDESVYLINDDNYISMSRW